MVFATDAHMRLYGVSVLVMLLAWLVLYVAAHYVSLLVARSTYVYLLGPEQALWRQSALSIMHAVLVASGGMMIAVFNIPTYTYPMFAYSEQALLFYAATTAHAIASTLVALRYVCDDLTALNRSYRSVVGWETATYCLIGLVGVPTLVAYRQATWFISTCAVMEVVTPLLALRRMLQLAGLRASPLYGWLRLAIVTTFVPVRGGLSLIALGRIAFHYLDWLDLNPLVRLLGFGVCGAALVSLNAYSATVLALSTCRCLARCAVEHRCCGVTKKEVVVGRRRSDTSVAL